MGRTMRPVRKDLINKIMKELGKNSEGIWIRELARKINEPVTTVHKYVTINEAGYPGQFIEVIECLPQKLGGHKKIKLKFNVV